MRFIRGRGKKARDLKRLRKKAKSSVDGKTSLRG